MTGILLSAFLASAAYAAPPSAKVIAASGRVSAATGGVTRAAKTGDALADGDTLATGPASSAIAELPDGSRVKLRESTSLKLQISAKPAGMSGVFLELGGVFARVTRGQARHFGVSTAHAVASVRGTEFFTAFGRESGDGRDLWICVGKGAVEVKADASPEPMLVNEGKGVLLPGGRKTTKPQFYEWTRELNWNMDPSRGAVADETKLDAAYSELRDQDYR